MFEALLVSLGEYKLLKQEDGGRVFPAGRYRVPDFRVVLHDGTQWLIEVKNVYELDPFHQRRHLMTKDYRGGLADYAAATGAELKFAVFWARWSIWTLVSLERLLDAEGTLELDMETAMRVSEMSRLGDRTIGTCVPLTARHNADPERTSPISNDGTVSVTIGAVQIFCDGVEVTDQVEKEIAWVFIEHGEWREHGPNYVVDGDQLGAIEFWWAPEELTDQGFEMVGTLSRMFARYYAGRTVEADAVVQLRAPLRPGWFALPSSSGASAAAPSLWRFELQPNYEGLGASPTTPDRANSQSGNLEGSVG